jgi:glycosyltransferase involved in cell wall biosynthesis
MEILLNPVLVPDPSDQPPRTRREVVFSGTLTYKKGVVPLMAAWQRVAARSTEAELHLYGKDGRTTDGRSMLEHLLSLCDEPARARIHFHGHVSQQVLYAALRRARVSVFPSYAEACGLAPLESMACACPTIAGSTTSLPELLEHGRDALLVDPDQTAALADAILSLLADDDLARRLGEAGKCRVRDTFSMEVLLPQNEAFYRRSIDDFDRSAHPVSPAAAQC